MSKFEERVCNKIQERAEVGKKKYGVTMERDDLNALQWLIHLQEEMMDAAVYIEKLLSDLAVCSEYIKNPNWPNVRHSWEFGDDSPDTLKCRDCGKIFDEDDLAEEE